MISASAITGLPEIEAGADLAGLILARCRPAAEDVLVLAHKAVSKAEGRVRHLADISAGPKALELAAQLPGKDPRHVQAVLDESEEVMRCEHGVMICRTRQGFVCANAGVDTSNAAEPDCLILLPLDPDASARALRAALRQRLGAEAPAVLIADSFGRAWRNGQCDVALGIAGLRPLEDWRGRRDSVGMELHATWIAIADQVAAAADLARTKRSREPAVLVSGLDGHVSSDDGPGAQALLRPLDEDLFR